MDNQETQPAGIFHPELGAIINGVDANAL